MSSSRQPDAWKPAPRRAVSRPRHLDLKKDRGLTVTWENGQTSFYPIIYLRKMSPSADARALREEMARNPLTVLPAGLIGTSQPLTATGVEMIGNYAIRIIFSDGHDTGIYSWDYLREIDQTPQAESRPGESD